MAGRKVFTSGEILTAADVNSYLMDQSVMVFADSTARSSAIPTPTEGMVTFREDQDVVEVYDGSAFKTVGGLVAVKDVLKTDTFSASLSGGANTVVTGLTIDHALSDSQNKLLLFGIVNGGREFGLGAAAFSADGTLINIGDASGSRTRVQSVNGTNDSNFSPTTSITCSYSPGNTNTITYGINVFNIRNTTDTYFVNRANDDSDLIQRARAASSFILMEVAV